MKKIKKYLVIIIATIVMLTITGCIDIIIDGQITEDNIAKLTYTLAFVDVKEKDDVYNSLMDFLYELTEYWQEEGFNADIVVDDDNVTALCMMEKQCETREEAFEALYGFLSNDITVFDKIDYTYNSNFYSENYAIDVVINFEGIIDENIYSEYPKIVGEDIDKAIEKTKCAVRFELPYIDSSTESTTSTKLFEQNVSFDRETRIHIEGIIDNVDNIEYEKDLQSKKGRQELLIIIFSILALLSVVSIVDILILKRKRKNGDSKSKYIRTKNDKKKEEEETEKDK